MLSPFLIFRFVFFALLVYLTIFILIAMSLNIHATLSVGLSVPGSAVLALLNCCGVFFFVALGLAELVYPHALTAQVKFECSWTMVFALFQFGTTLGWSINGALMCPSTSDWSICATSALLLPAMWLSSFMLLGYSLTFLFTSLEHVQRYPGIWATTVYRVPWFNCYPQNQYSCKPEERLKDCGSVLTKVAGDVDDDGYADDCWANRASWTGRIKADDIEALTQKHPQFMNPNSAQAPWAETSKVRRGLDNPFAPRAGTNSHSASSSFSSRNNAALPPLPLKVQKSLASDRPPTSRFIERFRESMSIVQSNSTTLSSGSSSTMGSGPRLTTRTEDYDSPLLLPRLSEWIRADQILGINGHTLTHGP